MHISENKPPHILILGCGRSGTSIFSELFNYLPSFTMLSEPYFDDLSSVNFQSPTAIKVPRESKYIKPDPGLSISLQAIQKLIPEPLRIYWIIRHPLDTICSLKVGISKNWGHHPRPPDWKLFLKKPLLVRCAHHWNYINSNGFDQLQQHAVLKRFEKMISDPQQFSQEILSELNLQNSDKLNKWTIRVQDQFNEHFIEAQTSRPYSTRDHTVKVGRYKQELSKAEINLVKPLIESTAYKFGYLLSDE